jgi:glycosyltransferase involved in cell wall biosynthesis
MSNQIAGLLEKHETCLALVFASDFTFGLAKANGTFDVAFRRLGKFALARRKLYVVTADTSREPLAPGQAEHIALGKFSFPKKPALFVLTSTIVSMWSVVTLLRLRHRIDAVVITPAFPVTRLLRSLVRLPIVLCLPYYPGWHPSYGLLDLLKKMAYTAFVKSALDNADLVIVPSPSLKHLVLRQGVGQERILLTTRFTTNFERFTSWKSTGVLGRKLKNNQKVLIYHGRLVRLKGLDTLLKAFVLLPRDKFHLILIGRGADEERLKHLAASLGILGSVSFLGSIPNQKVSDYIGDADVYVFPSLTEGWPKSIIESMLMAKPIVASRIPGVTDLLEDGKSALLFEPSNARDLAAKIIKVSSDEALARRLGTNARLEATELHAKAINERTSIDVCL